MTRAHLRRDETSKGAKVRKAREKQARDAFGNSEFTIREAMGAFGVGYSGASNIMRQLVSTGVVASRKRGVYTVFCFDLNKRTKTRPRERTLSDEDLVTVVDAAIGRYAKQYPRHRTFNDWDELRSVAGLACLGECDPSRTRLEKIEYLIRRCVFAMLTHEKEVKKIKRRFLNAANNDFLFESRAIDRANADVLRAKNSVALWGICWDYLLENADPPTLESFLEERPYAIIEKEAGLSAKALYWRREQVIAALALDVLNVRFGKYWRQHKKEWFRRCDELIDRIIRGDAPLPSRELKNVAITKQLNEVF